MNAILKLVAGTVLACSVMACDSDKGDRNKLGYPNEIIDMCDVEMSVDSNIASALSDGTRAETYSLQDYCLYWLSDSKNYWVYSNERIVGGYISDYPSEFTIENGKIWYEYEISHIKSLADLAIGWKAYCAEIGREIKPVVAVDINYDNETNRLTFPSQSQMIKEIYVNRLDDDNLHYVVVDNSQSVIALMKKIEKVSYAFSENIIVGSSVDLLFRKQLNTLMDYYGDKIDLSIYPYIGYDYEIDLWDLDRKLSYMGI